MTLLFHFQAMNNTLRQIENSQHYQILVNTKSENLK